VIARALAAALRARERTLAALLVGGAVLLAVEVRFEHREALGERWQAWIPLVYAVTTALLGGAALLAWERGGRRALLGLFAAGLVIGPAGVLFHSEGHPLRAAGQVLSAWRLPPGQGGGIGHDHPPALAPLAFAGLAALGVVVCARIPEK
jgi:hypothetical protein